MSAVALPQPRILHLSLVVGGDLVDGDSGRLGQVDDLIVPPPFQAPAAIAARSSGSPPPSVTACRPDQVWALDYIFDATADYRPIKILNVTDEHTREALACVAARSINANQTVDILANLVALRERTPQHVRCDNGPELVADTLRDWCRYAGTSPHYIEPGAPWQNPYVESFNGHLRRELLEMESFNTLYEARLLLEDWRHDYNHHRPHQFPRMACSHQPARS